MRVARCLFLAAHEEVLRIFRYHVGGRIDDGRIDPAISFDIGACVVVMNVLCGVGYDRDARGIGDASKNSPTRDAAEMFAAFASLALVPMVV